MEELKEGLAHTSELTVQAGNTALSMGSGDLEVLATPAMLALMENAAMLAVAGALPQGSTTVGGQISSSHLMPTPVGATVKAKAVLERTEGRKLYFHVDAHDAQGNLLGQGTHLRFIVDRQRFMSKL